MLNWLRDMLGESRQIIDLRIQVTTLTAQAQTNFQELLGLREKLTKLEEERLKEVKMMSNWLVNQSGGAALFQDVPHTDPPPAPPAEAIYRQSGRERLKRELFDAVQSPMANGFDLGANHPVALRHERDRRAAEKGKTEKGKTEKESPPIDPASVLRGLVDHNGVMKDIAASAKGAPIDAYAAIMRDATTPSQR